MSLFVAVLLLYVNGAVVDSEMIGTANDLATCTKAAPLILEKLRGDVPSDIQLEVKCLNYGDAPRAASVFGTKPAH